MVTKKRNEYHQVLVSIKIPKTLIFKYSFKSIEQAHASNVYHPLRDMGLETSVKKDSDIDEFSSHENRHLTMPKQQHIENWLDVSEFELSCKEFCFENIY
jgi:hypothetical protein